MPLCTGWLSLNLWTPREVPKDILEILKINMGECWLRRGTGKHSGVTKVKFSGFTGCGLPGCIVRRNSCRSTLCLSLGAHYVSIQNTHTGAELTLTALTCSGLRTHHRK